jgi:hypothetical protein
MLAVGSLAFMFFLPAQQIIITVDFSYDVFPPGSLYTLEGFVLSIERTPLSEAEVEINVGDTVYRTETDNLGLFSREVLLPTQEGTHRIRISASHSEGRGEHTMEVSVG